MEKRKFSPSDSDGNRDEGIGRREFVQLAALVSAGAFMPFTALGQQRHGSGSNDSQAVLPPAAHSYLTPVFLLGQASRLALGCGFFHPGLKHCLTADIRQIVPGNAFRVGAVVPFRKDKLLPVFVKLWKSPKHDQALSQKLAITAGGLACQAAEAELEKAGNASETGASGIAEHKIYQDAALVRAYLTKGKNLAEADALALESLFRQMLPRTFTRFHTLMPDSNGAAWIANSAAWRRQADLYFGELARAIAVPEPAKIEKHLTATGFFNGSDTILKETSTFTKISMLDKKNAHALADSGKQGSVCAKALAAAFHTLMALDRFAQGEIGPQDLDAALGQ